MHNHRDQDQKFTTPRAPPIAATPPAGASGSLVVFAEGRVHVVSKGVDPFLPSADVESFLFLCSVSVQSIALLIHFENLARAC